MNLKCQELAADISPLLKPLNIRGTELRNRFIMPAMQRGWLEDGIPQPKYIEYFRRRAQGGVGLIIVESSMMDDPSANFADYPSRVNEDALAIWAKCASEVHEAGSHILMQLGHVGALRKKDPQNPDVPTLSASGLYNVDASNGRPFTAKELEDTKRSFVRAAVNAHHAGFDGVEIHCAHGYMLDQFLWSVTNKRTDGYGGPDIRCRGRFPAEIISAVRENVPEKFIISVRLSQFKEVDYDAKIVDSPDELEVLVKLLQDAGTDIFHISTRRFWKPEWPGSDLGLAGWVKSFTDAAVITVGSVGLSIDALENFFNSEEAHSTGGRDHHELIRRYNGGEFDLVAIGRSILADPDYINKVRAGDFKSIRVYSKKELIGEVDVDLELIVDSRHQSGMT